jgi:membrane-bound lytic murein transglycosylase D
VRSVRSGLKRPLYYRVRPGDSISFIAHRFAVSTSEIRRWNHLSSSKIKSGQRLLVYRPIPVR